MSTRWLFALLPLGAALALRLSGAESRESAASVDTAFVASLPAYAPAGKVSGTIRIWGHGSFKHDFMGPLVRRWTEGFNRYHPSVTIENKMYGTASAIGALYTGTGEIALLGEEISPAAAAAFQRVKGYPPTGIQIATGSLDVNFFDYAHMIFVHRDNPITQLTLAQLDAIFGDEHRRGPKNIRTWSELGVTGEWASHPIQPYSWKIEEDFALFFREAVLENSHRWNAATKEYVHIIRPDGTQYDHGQQILDALAQDRFGIAISNVRYANSQVRALALARDEGGPYYAATNANLIAQKYPLTRIIPAFIDRPPGKPVDPAVREFLRYLLSREGQQALLEESAYLPLSADVIRAQREKLAGDGEISGPTARSNAMPPPAETPQAGVMRVWGNGELKPLLGRWQDGFKKTHGAARIESKMIGSDAAMAGLYTGQADLALLGRDATAAEAKAFEWIFRYQPTRVEIATGSLGTPGYSPALVVFVHRDNPLARLSLAQVDAFFGAERRRGASAALRTWGDLGLNGEWVAQPVNLYAADADTGTGRYFQEAALGDSRKLNWAHLREFGGDAAGQKILAALAADRFGLAVANLGSANASVKPIALAVTSDGPWIAATRESVIDRTYPLTRIVVAYVNRKPGAPLDPDVREFLRYMLGGEGQQDISRTDKYLPLADAAARAQRASLD